MRIEKQKAPIRIFIQLLCNYTYILAQISIFSPNCNTEQGFFLQKDFYIY